MLTLATQCGLFHYLESKLLQHNVIPGWKHQRSLLDYALVPASETEEFISVGVVTTLLKYGANPNKCEKCLERGLNSPTSPWQNALSYLNVKVSGMGKGPRKSYIVRRWIPIIKTLLDSGANPYIGCPMPLRHVNIGHRRYIEKVQSG